MFFFLPYGNGRQTRRYPAVTYILIALNVMVHIWSLPGNREVFIYLTGFIPAEPSLLDAFSSMFVHEGVYHLAWNMLFLWLFGPNVEDALGKIAYTLVYFGSGLVAAVLHVFIINHLVPAAAGLPLIGASGAIAGILGIFAIRFYKTNIKVFWAFVLIVVPVRWGKAAVPAVLGLGLWFLIQLYGGLQGLRDPMGGGVAYWTHIGGMMFGMLLASAANLGLEGSKEYLMADARSHLLQGTTWDAIANLEALVRQDPQNTDAYMELARVYAGKQNPHQAIPCFKKAIEIYLARDDRDKAAAAYSEMRDYYRDATLDLRSEYRIARHMMEICCHKPAVRMFQNISLNHPNTPEAEVSLMKAGDICMDALEDPQRAVYCYERFLSEYPQSTYRATVEKALEEARRRLSDQ